MGFHQNASSIYSASQRYKSSTFNRFGESCVTLWIVFDLNSRSHLKFDSVVQPRYLTTMWMIVLDLNSRNHLEFDPVFSRSTYDNVDNHLDLNSQMISGSTATNQEFRDLCATASGNNDNIIHHTDRPTLKVRSRKSSHPGPDIITLGVPCHPDEPKQCGLPGLCLWEVILLGFRIYKSSTRLQKNEKSPGWGLG
jgi:hypothetical protein